jgi:hypothetical protein
MFGALPPLTRTIRRKEGTYSGFRIALEVGLRRAVIVSGEHCSVHRNPQQEPDKVIGRHERVVDVQQSAI